MHTIENEYIKLKVQDYGAEMCSLVLKKTGMEYIWKGDPNIWKWHAPICFPIIGRLADDQYEINGKKYHMTVHGFARECNFTVTEKKSDMLCFGLYYDENTLMSYPYKFRLAVIYKLKGSSVEIIYKVNNLDIQEFGFSIGAHTGFYCPFNKKEFNDYSLYFDKNEKLECYLTTKGFLNGKKRLLETDEGELPISEALFAQDVLVFKKMRSKNVRLQNRLTGQFVAVDFADFPYLGIWAKPTGAPFICIEPWFGMLDDGRAKNLAEKKDICVLKPGYDFSCRHIITIG